jgi:hypothetical protein
VCANRNLRGVLACEPTRAPRQITWPKQSDRSVSVRQNSMLNIPTALVTSRELTWREDSVSPAIQCTRVNHLLTVNTAAAVWTQCIHYCNTYNVHLLLFCTLTNQCTIISQIITLLHVSTLPCHPQGFRNEHLAKLHKHFKRSCW